MIERTPDQETALEAARVLARLGVPIFRAPARRWVPRQKMGFELPEGWQRTEPGADSFAAIDEWQPGEALCAVMGVVFDLLDFDPRSGGKEAWADIRQTGLMPYVYAQANTPQNGVHCFVRCLGVGSRDGVRDGLDVKGGRPDGSGRGFAFIAPTVRLNPDTSYALPNYVWRKSVDPEEFEAEYTADVSGEEMAELVRSALRIERSAPLTDIRSDDPFAPPRDTATIDEAKARYLPVYDAFKNMRTPEDVNFNQRLNEAAMVIGHFVPAFMTYEQATEALYNAALHNRSVEFQGDRGVYSSIRSGLMAGMREPVFRREDPEGEDDADDPATAPDAADRFAPLDWIRLYETDFSVTNFLPGGLWEAGQQVALIGDGKVGKSVLMLEWAYACVTGRPFLGHGSGQDPLRVLYLDRENSQRDIVTRLRAFGASAAELAGLIYLSFPPFRPLDSADGADEVMALVAKYGPHVVILDTISRYVAGKENDSDTWLALYRLVHARLKAQNVNGVRLDHFGKDAERGGRGSSAKAQDIDHVWELTEDGPARELTTPDHIQVTTDLTLERTHTRTGLGVGQVLINRNGRLNKERGAWLDGHSGHVIGDSAARGWLVVQEVCAQLDAANVPRDAGRDTIRDAGRAMGIKLSSEKWSEIARYRRTNSS